MMDWWGGLTRPDDEEDDPVQKALGLLNQGVSAVGQGLSDAGAAIGSTVSSYLPSQPSQGPHEGPGFARSDLHGIPQPAITAPYQDTFTPTPEPAAPPSNPISPYVPSYAPRASQVTAAQAPTSDWAGAGRTAIESVSSGLAGAAEELTTGTSGAVAGLRPPETAQEVFFSSLPAMGRAGVLASGVGQAFGTPAARTAAAGAGATDEKQYGTPAFETPAVGPIPSVQVPELRFSQQDIAGAVGGMVADPTNWVLPGSAADVAADLAVRNLAGAAARGVGRGVGRAAGAVTDFLDANAARVAAADARMAAEGSTVAPGAFGQLPNIESRITAASSALDAARATLDEADAVVARAADSGSADDFIDARRAYAQARRAYDAAADAAQTLHEERRAVSGRIEQAGYGVPSEDAGVSTTAQPRDVTTGQAVPPYRLEGAPSVSLNAGFGQVPADRSGRRWVPDARYQSGGYWWTPSRIANADEVRAGIIQRADLREAERRVADANGAWTTARTERAEIERQLRRAPDDPELQQALMGAIRHEEYLEDTLNATREWHQMVRTGDRTLATAGAVPDTTRSPDLLGAAARTAGQSLMGSMTGAYTGAALPAETDEERRQHGLMGAAAGLVGGPLLSRGVGAVQRGVGARGARGALSTVVPPGGPLEPRFPGMGEELIPPLERGPGVLPPELRTATATTGLASARPPEAPSLLARFPGAAAAWGKQQERAQQMAARGLTAPSNYDWMKQAIYSGIYSPQTALNAFVGGLQELTLAQPKEALRAAVEGRPRPGSGLGRLPEGVAGARRVLSGDAAASAAASGGSQGTANLSERVTNPWQYLAARAMERPGEILTEAPDALFRPALLQQGMEREAGRVAQELGHTGPAARAYASQLLQDADAVRGGALPQLSGTQRVIDAATTYADELGYKGDPGGFGRWLGTAAQQDNAVGVFATLMIPFAGMTGRVARGTLRMIPGVGEIPALKGANRTTFDVRYDQGLGAAAGAGIALYAMGGNVTGSGPDDPEKRKELEDLGVQWNSTYVGVPGTDYGVYLPNRMFQRFQPILDAAGEMHDALAYGKKDRSAPEWAGDVLKRASKVALDQTGLQGLTDLHDLVTGGSGGGLPGAAARTLTRVVPWGGTIRAAATAIDPLERRPDRWREGPGLAEFGQHVAMAVPGARQRFVPPAQGVYGQELENPRWGPWALAPKITSARNDPLTRMFLANDVDIGQPKTELRVAKSASIPPIPLRPDEQRRWKAFRGEALREAGADLTRDPDFPSAPLETRQKVLRRVLEDAARAADGRLLESLGDAEIDRRVTAAATQKAG